MVRVLAKGGILTPSNLLKILDLVKSSGNKHLHIGSRQDLLFPVSKNKLHSLKGIFQSFNTDYTIYGRKDTDAQNIVSSYVASDMTAETPWISSGNYLTILEKFNYLPTLRINITDPKQSLVPIFYGHLNYVASTVKDFWFLFIRKNYTSQPECWPVLVLSSDIANLSKTLENKWNLVSKNSIPELFEIIQGELNYNWHKTETPFKLENLAPTDYEGFGKMHNSHNFWAGFYWRNNCYDITFLEELCHLCHRTNISKICLTPWKSFVIKDIKEVDLKHWHRLLGRFGINMRHSSFELNWHLPLQDKHALKLKRFIVKQFDKADVCVHGLTFGIKTKPEPIFSAIQIEIVPGTRFIKFLYIFNSYRIMHAKNFNANTCEYVEYLAKVPLHRLPATLHELTLNYYAQYFNAEEIPAKETKSEKEKTHIVHQCKDCLTVYDDKIEKLPFNNLPETYSCQLCDAPKSAFQPVSLSALYKNALI